MYKLEFVMRGREKTVWISPVPEDVVEKLLSGEVGPGNVKIDIPGHSLLIDLREVVAIGAAEVEEA